MTGDFDLIAFLNRLRDWGFETFGPGERRQGVCDHIKRELEEVERGEDDVIEWVDVALLAMAGALRSGWSVQSIASSVRELRVRANLIGDIGRALDAAYNGHSAGFVDIVNLVLRALQDQGWPREAAFHLMLAKQIKNEARTWPDWRAFKDGEVIEHVRP